MAFDDYTKTNKHDTYLANSGKRIVAQGLPPVVTVYQEGESRFVPSVDSVIGKKNPNYRQQIRDVLSATTPCQGEKSKITIKQHPLCSLHATFAEGNPFQTEWTQSHVGFVYRVGDYLNHGLVDPALLTFVENRSIAKLYNQLNGFASAVKAGEDLGEIKQTIDAIKRPLPGLRKLIHETFGSAKKAFSKPTASGIAKAAADTWLQWQFGYKPLESTIAGAVVGLQNRDVMANYRPFHAKEFSATGNATSDFAIPPPGGNIACDIRVMRETIYEVTFQGIWAEECDLPQRAISSVLGLEARDVLPTIWNLIPFSFLADYFANVGDIVGALAVPWGGVKWCNKTVRSNFSSTVHQSYLQNFTDSDKKRLSVKRWVPQTGIINRQRVTFVRSAQSTLPLPALELTSPLDLSWRQYANIAALTLTMGSKLAALAIGKVAQHPKLPSLFLKEMDKLPVGARPLRSEFRANQGLVRGAR
ncbi:maturation protein [ssRNA phage Esthiorhiza.4_4]|uniref:Maturation protein n=2 Tax=Norzivirales TaxID=2842247 RepID=A0A8S5KZN3_9VIRU|nr:maturation protein [ssRNA phage Esthiorhiza.4_4]QDH90884.1 MAG: hypothetical protein H4RhizoLitter20158_000001 [Leviviridae sp.]DAD50314.1 TPA_asm: maturation protein [ssRNA phage Esthiorhiza.4_4]